MHPRSVLKGNFVERIRRILLLNIGFSIFKTWSEKAIFGDEFDHFEHDLGLDYVFSP